ncbi:MAG: hypothetical protein RLZZ319_13 [Actinomycetota bacterium]
MRFILFVIDDATHSGTGDEIAAIDEFNESLQQGGHWVMAAGIGAPSTATLVDNRADAGEVEHRSLSDAPDFYSGFWVVDAPNEARALELALAGSRACNRRVELRPFL